MTWQAEAACRKVPKMLLDAYFWPNDPSQLTRDKAKAICDTCSVQQKCLQWALDTDYGSDEFSRSFIVAGMDYRERMNYKEEA